MSFSRRSFVAAASAASAFAQRDRKGGAATPTGPRPNILLILADDLAAWMLGCYGNKEIRTPNIDYLARGGVKFLNNFVCTPICSASRATLFTGRVPRQHGIHDFLTPNPIENPPQGQKAPPVDFHSKERMLSDILATSGYRCGYTGKWHLGNDEKPGHGFSYTYTMSGGSRSYTDPEMFLNGESVKESGYLTDLTTKRSLDFLDQQSAGTPFFLCASYLNPHTPYDGHPQKYYDLYKDTKFDTFGTEPAAPNALREKNLLNDTLGNLRRCAASVTALDDQIPILIRKLTEKGLRDNTLVIFTGDNGFLLGRHGLWSKGLASNPINMYEEVVRVPMIWNWPGKTPVEASAPELTSFYDFVPTVCEAAGLEAPSDRGLCGRSYLKFVKGEPLGKKETWRTTVFGHFRNTEMARDQRFKLVVRNNGQGPNELFDLKTDPTEHRNVYDNPQFITIRDRLAKDLAAWRQQTSA